MIRNNFRDVVEEILRGFDMDIYDIVLEIYNRNVNNPKEMETEFLKFLVFLIRKHWQHSEFQHVLVFVISILLTHLYNPKDKDEFESIDKKLIKFFLSEEFN